MLRKVWLLFLVQVTEGLIFFYYATPYSRKGRVYRATRLFV
ncbi:hypothetical protein BAOM_2312 [Peribacillus asahii]|uniref:Uncharacterized protein n=1 Tax=Peribacillus asahii TaxID=228899 RepID=A0A3Q9RMY2_9BACI|nr:hypothetical protein BAOM_2312 [Peribacillus asahii]